MQLFELFSPGKKWQWSFTGSEEAVAEFTVGDVPYQFYAYTFSENPTVWEVEFKNASRDIRQRSSKFGLTGTGNSAEVMGTVVDILREFLQRYQGSINELTFTADEPSRQALYTRMAKRLLPDWDMVKKGRTFTLVAPESKEELSEFSDAHTKKIAATMKNAGYKKIGSGADASVYIKDAGTVIKILMPESGNLGTAEKTFLEFYNFVQKFPGIPNLPKFYKIQGQHFTKFEIDGEEFYQIAMEQLYPIRKNSLEQHMVWQLADFATTNLSWEEVYKKLLDPNEWAGFANAKRIVSSIANMPDKQKQDYAYLFVLMQLLFRTGQDKKMGWDLHTANIMRRADGTLVIVDPWYTDTMGSLW